MAHDAARIDSGRLTNLRDQALETYLSYEETLRSMRIAVVAEVAAAQTSVDSARADIATYRTQVAQDLNSLTLLVGQPIDPALVEDIGADVNDPLAPLINTIGPVAEAPSELLQRRPDVLAAERSLRAANANIGAERAARFPSITRTTRAGSASSEFV